MLFDLRGRGRRTTVQVIYLTLALLMGGGLVLFGIGGDVSGGLVDAFREDSGSRRRAGTEDFEKPRRAKPTAAPPRARRTPRPRPPRPAPATSSPAPASTSTRQPARSPKKGRRSSSAPRRRGRATSPLDPQPIDDSVALAHGPGLRRGRASTSPRRPCARRRSSPRRARASPPSPRSPCSPTRPARPARATSRRREGGRAAPTRTSAPGCSDQLDAAKQQSLQQRSRTPPAVPAEPTERDRDAWGGGGGGAARFRRGGDGN